MRLNVPLKRQSGLQESLELNCRCLLMISCLVQCWCKLLIWGAVDFIAENSQSLLKRAAPGSPAGTLHPWCWAASVVRLCLNPNVYHKKNNNTGELVLGGRYLKTVRLRTSTKGSYPI